MACGLHDKGVFDTIRQVPEDIHPDALSALLEALDDHDLDLIGSCTDWKLVSWKASQILYSREKRRKPKNVTHRLNYPIDEVLNDYVQQKKGRKREARRQLRARFDGLDHAMQEAVMMSFMTMGIPKDREFIYGKLYGEGFWVEDYVPLVQEWWEKFHDAKMGKVVVKRCPQEYILAHLEELENCCNYATLCLRTGMRPVEGKLPARTYLFVLKSLGTQLNLLEGEEIVLKWVREYLYEEAKDRIYDSIFDIPYVKRMVIYLGEMGLSEDILALDAFDKSMAGTSRPERGTAVIKAIEKEFSLPEYIFKSIE